jgi:hypothetical protein
MTPPARAAIAECTPTGKLRVGLKLCAGNDGVGEGLASINTKGLS